MRLPEVEAVWASMSASWPHMGDGGRINQAALDQIKGMAPHVDQTPAAFLEQCSVSEHDVDGMQCFVYVPQAMREMAKKPALVFLRGAAFVIGSAKSSEKAAAAMAIRFGCVVISPEVGVGPEVPGAQIVQNGYSAVKWAVASTDALGLDAACIGMWGESSGGWLGLNVCRLLAERDEGGLLSLFVSDIGALDNDFVEHYASPENEPHDMHKACSRMHLGLWACLFTDVASAASFDWASAKDDPLVFPAQMEAALLSKIPPTVLMTSEFDHVGFRCANTFAARLKDEAPDRLLGLYVQPGTAHGVCGTAQEARNAADKLIIHNFLLRSS